MDQNTALAIADLIERQSKCLALLGEMKIGYCDEWEFRNGYTGNTVSLRACDWQAIKDMIEAEYKEVTDKINRMPHA